MTKEKIKEKSGIKKGGFSSRWSFIGRDLQYFLAVHL